MSRHHERVGWASISKKARARIKASLPAPCIRCGRLVHPDEPWDVGHKTDLALGGDVKVYGPAHRGRCNRSPGGKLGARIAQQNRRARARRDPTDPREPNW